MEEKQGDVINRYTLVPLIENVSTVDGVEDYKINGVQLFISFQLGEEFQVPDYAYLNLRNPASNDWNYMNKFTKSRHRELNMRAFGKFIVSETQLQNDLIVHSHLNVLNYEQVFKVIREVNYQTLNSHPLDFGNFINLPYFVELSIEKPRISTSKFFQYNCLRFFQNDEIFEGYKRVECLTDCQKIISIVQDLNDKFEMSKTGKNINPNFLFIVNPNTYTFSLSVLERILVNDEEPVRWEKLKDRSLILHTGNCIGYNFQMQSIVHERLVQEPPDYPTVEVLLNHMLQYENQNLD